MYAESSYGDRPPLKKKKKDSRVEIDGKPMSKYQRKLREKELRRKQGALSMEEEGTVRHAAEASDADTEDFGFASEFGGQFEPEILEEAAELLRASASRGNGDGGGRIRPDYRREACREYFSCAHCGAEISPEGAGSGHRNHCPHCLHSLHVDVEPGDRASDCRGDMEPIAIWVKDGGEWAIVHRCKKCGKLSTNRVLADDDPLQLMSLAVRALANPPFPLRMLRDCLKREG